MGQNQWYHVGVGAPPILVYFSGDWDVHSGLTGLFTHGHIVSREYRARVWLLSAGGSPMFWS